MATGRLGRILGQTKIDVSESIWHFDDDDWALIAMLQDPVYMSELLFSDAKNKQYGGCYHVMDYQYPLFRPETPYQGYPCARSVGKTESMKARGVCHAFKRQGEDMLITAPELIHLMPLCDAIEDRIQDTRLTEEFLDKRNGKTGFTHKPFQVDFIDGTRIVGRIPKISGTGVKGQHVPDLLVEEAQDYPEKGWIEVHETVIKDHTDSTGKSDFTYHFYGVHSGARDGRFYKLSTSGEFQIYAVTALMRPGWSSEEKRRAAAMYGGTTAPDYRRNILGEAGSASSAFFVTSRLMACVDQDRESKYNELEFKRQKLMAEEVDKILGGMGDDEYNVGNLLELPTPTSQAYHVGVDIGLVNDPTVISLWQLAADRGKKSRLQLIRLFELERFREKMVRQCLYRLGWHLGGRLRSAGLDVTGLGLPIFQAMEDDERAPQNLLDIAQGYVFSVKLPIGVDKSFVSKDGTGQLRDQYGNMVEEQEDPFTRTKRYIVKMPFIEASTRYLREWVDTGYLQLPFQPDIVGDMQGETEQRVKAMAGMKKKPNAFHILDSFRAMAMAYKHADVQSQVAMPEQQPVRDRAADFRDGGESWAA